MATHMVPQDVEAEDKLVGFLSLKQFIMTVIGIGFGYLTFFFFTKIHPLASIIWLPPTIVFFVLGLYHRKDQPIEVYLASALTFYFKPRVRKWDQEGHEDHVIITAPPKIEHNYTKNFTGEEAASRLQNLSIMMDSKGWASKNLNDWQNPQIATTATSDNRLVQPTEAPGQASIAQAYMQPADVMDESTSLVARDFENKIVQTKSATLTNAIRAIDEARNSQLDAYPADITEVTLPPKRHTEINQKVIQPLEEPTVNEASENKESVGAESVDNNKATEIVAKETNQLIDKTEDSNTNIGPKEHKNPDGSVEISLH